jgi:hypothetical protein
MSKTKGSRGQFWRSNVDGSMQKAGRKIVECFPEARNHNEIERTAAIHAYVYQKIDGENRDFKSGNAREMRMPQETWRIGKGNCQEVSLLIASLLKSTPNAMVRTIGLDHPDKRVGHRILQVGFKYNRHQIAETVDAFYRRSHHVDGVAGSFFSQDESSRSWVVTDRNRECLGDISFLEKAGYIDKYGDKFTWQGKNDQYNL